MLTGINSKEIFEHISIFDTDKENPTKFLLGIISCADKIGIVNKFEENLGKEAYYEVVKLGLKGIKNYNLNGEVKDIDVITDDVMNSIKDFELIKELFAQIIKINFLSGEERKN